MCRFNKLSIVGLCNSFSDNSCSTFRMKREVASAMVEKGVHERVRLTELYNKKKEELEKQHSVIKAQLIDEKAMVRDYGTR